MTLPAHLFEPDNVSSRKTLSFEPGSWPQLVEELRRRYPRLGERVLTDSGTIGNGFVLIVNDEVVKRDCTALQLHDGDECWIIAAIAGG